MKFLRLSCRFFVFVPSKFIFSCLVIGKNALNSDTISVKRKFTPKVDAMSLVLRTKTSDIMIPIKSPDALRNHTEFDTNNPLVIFVTGWKTNMEQEVSEAQNAMADAYLCRGNVNFVVNCSFNLFSVEILCSFSFDNLSISVSVYFVVST